MSASQAAPAAPAPGAPRSLQPSGGLPTCEPKGRQQAPPLAAAVAAAAATAAGPQEEAIPRGARVEGLAGQYDIAPPALWANPSRGAAESKSQGPATRCWPKSQQRIWSCCCSGRAPWSRTTSSWPWSTQPSSLHLGACWTACGAGRPMAAMRRWLVVLYLVMDQLRRMMRAPGPPRRGSAEAEQETGPRRRRKTGAASAAAEPGAPAQAAAEAVAMEQTRGRRATARLARRGGSSGRRQGGVAGGGAAERRTQGRPLRPSSGRGQASGPSSIRLGPDSSPGGAQAPPAGGHSTTGGTRNWRQLTPIWRSQASQTGNSRAGREAGGRSQRQQPTPPTPPTPLTSRNPSASTARRGWVRCVSVAKYGPRLTTPMWRAPLLVRLLPGLLA